MPLYFQMSWNDSRQSECKVNNKIPNPNYISSVKSSHCLQIITYSLSEGAESSGSCHKTVPPEPNI